MLHQTFVPLIILSSVFSHMTQFILFFTYLSFNLNFQNSYFYSLYSKVSLLINWKEIRFYMCTCFNMSSQQSKVNNTYTKYTKYRLLYAPKINTCHVNAPCINISSCISNYVYLCTQALIFIHYNTFILTTAIGLTQRLLKSIYFQLPRFNLTLNEYESFKHQFAWFFLILRLIP